jgi:hypothetical protein
MPASAPPQETCARWRSIVANAGAKQETALRTQLKVLQTKGVEDRTSSVLVDFRPAKVLPLSSGLDESGLHSYLKLVAQYAPDELQKLSLDHFKELFKAYTPDDASWRALNLGVSSWSRDDKPGLAPKLAALIRDANGFGRYSVLDRSS